MYDTTSSMSSPNGVQAHIKKEAPDADYQGCCLHSLNLVICNASAIMSVQNMFDSCQQVFLFYHNSPKPQCFFELVIESFCPTPTKKKIKGLGQTRWVEQHTTFDTIFDLYPYLMQTWEEICCPSNCDQLYKDSSWNWDSESCSC